MVLPAVLPGAPGLLPFNRMVKARVMSQITSASLDADLRALLADESLNLRGDLMRCCLPSKCQSGDPYEKNEEWCQGNRSIVGQGRGQPGRFVVAPFLKG